MLRAKLCRNYAIVGLMNSEGMDLIIASCVLILSFAVHSNADGPTNGYLNFVTHHVYVPEKLDQVAAFNLRRVGGSAGEIFFHCKIINSTSTKDFESNTAIGRFADGVTQSTCEFNVIDDNIPEPNITYSVGIVIQGIAAEIGVSNVSFVTILSNDDPFGSIGFEVPSQRVSVAEPLDGQISIASFDVVRLKGSIGTSSIFYKVDNGGFSAITEIINPSGNITFHDGERRKKLNVSIRPDNKPDNAMQFTVVLVGVSGGAILNETSKRASLVIEENDYPLQLDKSTEQASESQILPVTVKRGLLGAGRVVTTVDYNTVDGTAKSGVDYTSAGGTLTFAAGETSKVISITILKDPLPEIAENFTVVLSNPSPNSVLVSPYILTIIIQKNDDPHGVISFLELNETQALTLDEDGVAAGVVKVNRSRGTIGTVVVDWRAVPGPLSVGIDPNSVLTESKGNLTFGSGISMQEFSVAVRTDNTPEEAVELYIELMNITGGARFDTVTPRAKVIVRDSDNAYGIVTLGNQSEHRVILSTTPRKIFASVRRSGGALAAVRVNYTVHYLLPGSSMPSSDVTMIYPGYVTIERGSHNATIEIRIGENAFLKSNAAFLVRLDAAELEKSTIISPKTPVLGTPTRVFINITSELANGEISFFNNPVSVTVDEPSNGQISHLSILVMRDGVSGPATVYWTLRPTTSTLTSGDVSPWNGTVHFAVGTDRVNITISVLPDNIPELDEIFTLEFTNVTEKNERLRTGGTTATVTIKRNDNAGGIFEFNHTGRIIIRENDAPLTVDVVRTGGALTTQSIRAEFVSGTNDFIGPVRTLRFKPNERKMPVYVYPIDDTIPEMNETFILRLTSIKGTVLGNRTSIEITILQNDDANGIFSFDNTPSNLKKYADEVRTMTSQISFAVIRNKGTFGTVSVYWNVTSLSGARASLDILHLTGTVVFNPGQDRAQLNIIIKPDQIPEGEERFEIRLISVNSAGKLASPVLADLTINPNDAPIQFLYPLHVTVIEGQLANLTIGLNRTLSQSITVYYSTIDVTASSSTGDYTMAHNKPVVFAAGERNKTISLETVDDNVAEIAEEFIVRLNGSTGDTVLVPPIDARVTIEPNDEPYGVFEFAQNSLSKTANEGSTVSFVINRSRGTFTNVTLNWEILSSSRLLLPDGNEFMKTRGSLLFHEGLSTETLSLVVRSDGIPELNETFYVRIVNITDNRGRLGNQTEAVVTILPNDDPYGVFEFAPASRQVNVAEDYSPGFINATYATLNVVNTKGSFASVQVLWQIYKASSSVTSSVWDLIFFGRRGNDIKTTPGRENSGTSALVFIGSNASYVQISPQNQPTSAQLQSGFTVSLWMIPTRHSNGTLIAKRSSTTNQIIFDLSLNASGFAFRDNRYSYTVTVPSSVNMFDGQWHAVVFTVSTSELKFYIDGKMIGPVIALKSAIITSSGNIYLGCSLPTANHYNGALQDVRMYPSLLIPAHIAEVSTTRKVLTPTNGYLNYTIGTSMQEIFTKTIDNSRPEQDTVYIVKLIGVKAPGQLASSGIESRLTILKSDDANGQFAFASSTCRANTMENQTNISFTVRRTIGSFGSVRVNWEIRQIDSSNLVASNDFISAAGFVNFADGDNEKIIVIRPFDDTVPELIEKFELRLTSAVSLDGSVSSTPRSGASIKPDSNKCNITISANDNPYGMLQIMPTKPTGSGIIQPLAMPLNVNVHEESGNVTLYVVRAQGVQGAVSCEWLTNQHSAIGNVDFRQGIGSVSFPQSANISKLTIDLLDNNIPELEKSFTVQLYNPSGGAVLGSASYINITILPSDDAFGVFQFANTSLNVTVQEASGVNAVLRVMRSGGALGAANVTWLLSNGSRDFTVEKGIVMFARGKRIGLIQIPVFNDSLPELTEAFSVQLTSVTKGRLASSDLSATVRIVGNDDPYGVFQMLRSSIRVQERNSTVSLTISRQGGDIGMIRVFYRTSISSSGSGIGNAATPDVDFASVSDSIVFQQGQRTSLINVTIFADEVPEIDEYFMVNITSVVLLSSGEVIGDSPRIGSKDSSMIIIEGNDNANGILQLSSSSLALHEGINGYFLNVTRSRGTFGTVSVRYTILDRGTVLGSDYQIASYLITLNSGQDTASVPITIVNDALPEFNESFVITLDAASLTGGAMLGNPQECTVTIVENDNPYGLIGFASGSLNESMQEPGSGQTIVTLTVLRNGGTFGTVQVEWNATLNNNLASSDVTPSRGNVRFLSGQSSQDISISILADNVPEDNEAIKIYLQYVSNGKASINEAAREATINIPPNDDPYGVVQFARSTISVLEKETDYYIDLPVKRTLGLFGSIKINYGTKEATTAINKASNGADYTTVISKSMTMGPGIANSNITIQILKDSVPELGENFLVEIISAEVVGLPAGSNSVKVVSPKIMNVTIIENDQPYGLFGVFITKTGTSGSSYAINEPESGSTSITFEVRRSQGDLGSVSIAWRVSSASTVNITNDVSGVSGGRLTFTNKETKKDFIIAVNSDNIPESDERLIIEIYDVQGGAVINPSTARAVLTIRANDGVGGRIGFSPGSRSKIVAEGEIADLNVYRTLPAAGNVTLNWTITGVNATRDFRETAGKLLLRQGIANAMLRLITLNDSVPESHETFTVRLSDPATAGISSTGAATLVAGDSTATIIIGASDEPHGIIEFASRSQPVRVKENIGHIDLRLVRNKGSIGQILVRYQIRGVRISQAITEGTYGQDFNSTTNGTISMPDGSDSATIRINIIDDNIPEQDEAFFVNITGVELVGSSNMTTQPKIGRLNYMQIQIEANDGTQGELAFAAKSARITVSEDIGTFNITVVRNKGLFGKVYAFYYLNRLTASASDFNIPGGVMTGPARIEFDNGQRERNITVFIHNDNITEPDEQFEIGLTIQNAENNGGVTIGSPDKSVVTISANDDANGVVQFAARSLTQYIAEPETVSSPNRTATFFVERKIGMFGTVSIQWRVLGVTNSSDVSPFSGVITFAPNDREKYFQVQAVMDDIPEMKKTYTVQLTVISGGSRLGTPNTASLIIAANDGPHGFLSVRTYPSMLSSLNMEEKMQFVKAVVRRSGGTLGKISVQYETKPRTAIAPNGTKIFYGFDHIFETRDAESFHSFTAYGQEYLILASSYRKQAGSLPVNTLNPMEPYESTLFRWQGAFVPLMTLKTDGCLKWKSFEENNTTYLVSVNHGAVGRYQTSSQVMKLHRNDTIDLVQNITTQGASDVVFFRSNGILYMITANMKDDSNNTNQQSQLLRWQGTRFSLESSSMFTTGASGLAVCTINGRMFVAVANHYNSRGNVYGIHSSIYSWSHVTKRFTIFQTILTYAATDVKCTTIGGELYLLFTNSIENSRLYKYKTTSPQGFVEVQEIKTKNAQTVNFFNWNNTDYIAFSGNTSMIFEWNPARKIFTNVSDIPVQNSLSIQPFVVTDPISGKLQYLAVTDGSKRRSYILRLDMLSENADFVPRRGLLTFYEGQASMRLDFTVLLDNRPEMDESFSVELSRPTGGAELATNPNLAVNILSNDNAYGRMAFVDASLRVNVTEQHWDSILKLDIVREFGSFGQVSLHWNISNVGGGSVVDLHPTNGQINLNQGISAASIYITVRADGIPELDELFRVSLTRVSIAGSPSSNRGPSINHLESTAVVTILANNDPYGIIGWKNRIEITTEETEVNSSALLVINRQAGTLGDIMVMYETQQALNVSRKERIAMPGVDYFTQSSSVLMKAGVREALVYIKVRHKELASDNHGGIKVTDNNTDVNEIFNVNITNVNLVSGTRVPNSPRIDENRRQVEVVITETVLNRGMVEFASPFMRRVSEDVGVVILPLVRSNGSEGTVGVHFMVNGLNASSADFSPQSGLVTFSNNVTHISLNITIVSDNIAELDEVFTVLLTKPSGGVKIGPSKQAQVTITENDYPYGLLEFNQASRVINGIAEGQTIHLTVDRMQGRYRSVRVDWSCGSQSQNDLNPWNGQLVFAENSTRAAITINTINDTIPETSEIFTCILSNPTNGAMVSMNNNATISILPSDKPNGVISIAAVSRVLTVGEPFGSYNGRFSISVLRSIGFDGLVTAHWRLNSVSGIDNSNITFNVTSGTVTFPSGNAMQNIYFQVQDDSTPEESKKYQLYLERVTGGAELDIPANTKSDITVAASDNPYGMVQFVNNLPLNVTENAGHINITATRTGGLIEQLQVTFMTTSEGAVPGVDFTPITGTITFNAGEGAKAIQFNIIDDTIPELTETFRVNMTSARVITSKTLNFRVVNGLQVDIPPKIGSPSMVQISINENDKPYGEIRFLHSSRLVHERDGTILIPVNRTGGTFGTSIVSYTYTEGSAKNPADFTVSGSTLTFAPGETQKFIPITIVNDKLAEFQETFQLNITSITGLAAIGSVKTMTVTVETSDNPYGLFGIYNTSLSVTVANPATERVLSFPVSRIDGNRGVIQVSWRVLRTVQSVSAVTEDISPETGTLSFATGERGPMLINVTVRTYGGPQEPEESFILQVYSPTGGAALDHAFTNVSITVQKKGHPRGLFRFDGTIFPSQTITEPETGATQIFVPVKRDFGNQGIVNVVWSITASAGSIKRDLVFTSTTLKFNNGEITKNIAINVTADNYPELDQVYELELASADNGAEINMDRKKMNFTVRANDYPHGLFSLTQASKRFEYIPAAMVRRLHFAVERKHGTIGNVQANIEVKYEEGKSTTLMSVTLASGQSIHSAMLNISSSLFVAFGGNFTVRIKDVNVIGQASTMKPAVDVTISPLQITIPEEAANSMVEFNASTRYPFALPVVGGYLVSNVQISRRGLFGNITVEWRTGYPPGTYTIGSISPTQGTLSFAQGERSKAISFQITLPTTLQDRLVYAVYLSSVTPAVGQPAHPKISVANTAIADPHGLVQISPNNRGITVVEGKKANILVRRLLSTVGSIRIGYTTQKYVGSNAATENVDFTPVTSTFDMLDGQATRTLDIDTIEDIAKQAEKDEFFYVVLTSVEVIAGKLTANSPRLDLSANTRAIVTIRDNDNPFGVISFTTQSKNPTTQESAGQLMLQLQRIGGVFSRVTVLIRSIGGGETWQDSVINGLPTSSPIKVALNARTKVASAASPNQDYLPLNKEVVFEELNTIPNGGQIKTVNISILQDSLSEPAEQIVLVLTNTTGGASLPTSSGSLKSFSVITIDGNGLWNGEIGFTVNSAVINEDGTAQVILPLQRNKGAAESIEVSWLVWSTVSSTANELVVSSGKESFAAGNTTSSLTISLKKDTTPEFASWFYINLTTSASGAVIAGSGSGLFPFCNITMLESDYPAGRIGFSDVYRFPVVTLGTRSKQLTVRRYNGKLKDVTVRYQTAALISVLSDGNIVMTPAVENKDFKSISGILTFPKGGTEAFINIELTPNTASVGAYPKVFNVTLFSPTNGAILHPSHKSEQIIISKDRDTATFLRFRSNALRIPLSDTEIENICLEMLQALKVQPLSDMNQNLAIKTIRIMIAYKASLPAGQKAFTNKTKNTLLDIYDSLLLSTRTDTRGKSDWAVLLDELAYAFLNDMPCPHTFTGSKSNFAMTSRRDKGSNLNGMKFTSGRNADFFRYPVNMFSSSSPCTDLHFIDYGNQQFFSSGKAVLNNKVMSSKIKSGLSSGMKVVYRVHTSKARVSSKGVSCVIWQHPTAGTKGDWNTRNCKVKGETKTYVECECQHLSQYAVLALSDNRTGYETYFFVACFICIGACFLALMAHHLCAYETTFTANLLMHMIFAIMMTNILYAVGAYISPTLMNKPTNCGILGVAIHYFFLTQFSWMFVQGWNLWRILVLNDEHSDRKFVAFFLMGYGLPVLIVVGYIFITYAVYRWPFPTMYGDVHSNGDMCFMANDYSALGSVIIPVVLFVVGVAVVFLQSYQLRPQWKCYDDVYRGRYNIKEMRHLIAIYALLFITWLFAGLHLAFGSLWMIITFTALNIILGLYILVVYAIIRNQMRHLCHGEYAVRAAPSLISDHELIYAPGSLNQSAMRRKFNDTQSQRSNRLSDWEDVELPVNLNPMDFPDKERILDSPDAGRVRGRVNESYDNDMDSDEFDDLIFALKTGGRLTPSVHEEQELQEKMATPRSMNGDQPQIRRIKIADTHL